MKGVSKYGQFIVKSNNSHDENNISEKSTLNFGGGQTMLCGTKLVIKNGKLHAPLTVRSTNIISTESIKEKTFTTSINQSQNIRVLERLKSETTNNSNNRPQKEKFEVFCDLQNDENDERRLNVCLNSSSTFSLANATAKLKTSSSNASIASLKRDKIVNNCFTGRMEESRLIGAEKASTSAGSSNPAITDEKESDDTEACADLDPSCCDEFDLASAHFDSGNYSSSYMTAKTNFYERTTSYSKINFSDTNSLYVTYDSDVYEYLLWREASGFGRPRFNYMAKQNEINIEMRAILIDWFVDVCLDYDLSPFTFFLTVSIVDRTLSTVDCPREKFQLLGATAIFIATKMEDLYPPKVNEIAFLTEDACTSNQIKKMEKIVLRVINFDLNVPKVDIFAHFFLFYQPCCKMTMCLVWYLLELSCLNYDCLKYRLSRVAAAAFSLAIYAVKVNEHRNKASDCGVRNHDEEGNCDYEANIEEELYQLYDEECWSTEMITKTGIKREEFAEPLKQLAILHEKAKTPSTLHAMFLKYGTLGSYQVSRKIVMPMRLPFSE